MVRGIYFRPALIMPRLLAYRQAALGPYHLPVRGSHRCGPFDRARPDPGWPGLKPVAAKRIKHLCSQGCGDYLNLRGGCRVPLGAGRNDWGAGRNTGL